MNATLLLIDDDVPLCDKLRVKLSRKGFRVEVSHSLRAGLRKACALKPDAMILDLTLPDLDGSQVCRDFRQICDVPIILVSTRGSREDVVEALNLGADAYMVKPLSAEILAARVRALLRRTTPATADGNGWKPRLICDNLVIDFEKHKVAVNGEEVYLSPTEFRLLSLLAKNKGRVVPHELLLTEVWGPEYSNRLDQLRLYISYLRRKIERNTAKPSLIHNKRGIGYRFGERVRPH